MQKLLHPGGQRPVWAEWGPEGSVLGVVFAVFVIIAGGLLLVPFVGTTGLNATLANQLVLSLAFIGVAFGIARRGDISLPFRELGIHRPTRPHWIALTVQAFVVVVGFCRDLHSLRSARAIRRRRPARLQRERFRRDRGRFRDRDRRADLRGDLLPRAAVRWPAEAGALHRRSFDLGAFLRRHSPGDRQRGRHRPALVPRRRARGAWLYERTGSLWAPIALHGVNNAIAFTLLVST